MLRLLSEKKIMKIFYSIQYMKLIFTTRRKEHMSSVEKRDSEKCIIYDSLLKHYCDMIRRHIYCPWSHSIRHDRQCTYKLNIIVRSYNHCCSGKAVSTTYSECVFLVLGIQHAKGMRLFVMCALSGSTLYFQIIL